MSILRSKHSGWTWEGRRTPLDGGGGGGAPVQQTVSQTNIPDYARPYVETMLGKTQALTDINKNPYQPYAGQRFAGFTPMQAQAFQNVANQQVAGQIGEASNLASQAGQTSLGAFGQGQQLGQQALGYGAQAAGAGQQYQQMATDPGVQKAYMSPYMQNVVDYQKQQAMRDYDIASQGRNAAAVRAGAFGGSRQAVAEGEANRALMNQMAGIQATGTQKAFEDAQRQMQYGSDLGLRGLGMGLQGVQGAVGAGQYGLQGLQQAGQAASTLGALGQTQFGQQSAINEAMARAGSQQQALQQQGLSADYQNYMESLNYPYKQLGFMSDMLRGLPLGQSSQSIYQAPPSMVSQAAGLGTAGLGLYGMSRMFKEGGEVESSGLTDLQLHRLVGKA
jgi:hypothetical protein